MRQRNLSDDDVFLGLDVGGTFLKAARIDARGRVLRQIHEPIRKETAAELLGQFETAIRELEKDGPARAVGLGLPGIVERKTGVLKSAPNVQVLSGAFVGRELEALSGRATFAENDANAAALAESWLGAGRTAEHILFVTLGTGVGGGLVAVIVEAAREGDAVALEVVQGTARALGIGIAATLNLVNVDRVVIGGGVAQAGPFLLDRIAQETRTRTFAHVFDDVDFRAAELGADAGIVGAARVAMVGLHR
jgi:predicted NBD/HSP70 family sugar kinase